MAGSIYADSGDESDIVDAVENVPGQMTPIIEIAPDRGTLVRILNSVARGDEPGVPVFADLRDSNGDPLPTSTSVQFEVSAAGSSERFKVSREFDEISIYNTLTLSEQRNSDNIDATKHVLQQPETLGGEPVPGIEIEDVQDGYISIDSPVAVDWQNSALYVDSTAVKGPIQTGGS